MAPTPSANLSPAELSYLHTSLSLNPPIRPDARLPSQFRPLIAETDILPGTNGSARICFADGTEAIAGVKAGVEKTPLRGESSVHEQTQLGAGQQDEEMGDEEEEGATLGKRGMGENKWVDMTIEIPGYRDDDALPVFLAAMLSEALLSTRDLVDKLWINTRWHWRLYVDVGIALLCQSTVQVKKLTARYTRFFSYRHHFPTQFPCSLVQPISPF